MRIAILDDYHDLSTTLADWSDLRDAVTVFDAPLPAEDLARTLAPFEVICVMRERTPLPEAVIASLPKLRLIVSTGRRNGSIDVTAARQRGIVVCGTDSRSASTAQLAMTLLLMGLRNLPAEMNSLAEGGWQVDPGRDLDGLTLGLVGLGRLGAEVAALARPFGAEVIAWSENLTKARCDEVGVTHSATLSSLLERSDAVSIHLVLSERTRRLIGAAELGLMKPNAFLVNTSRSQILDIDALLDALRAGRPGMAALDVFDTEPLLPDDPLRDRELIEKGQLILTPHLGYGSRQTYELMYRQTVEAVRAWLDGDPVRELR